MHVIQPDSLGRSASLVLCVPLAMAAAATATLTSGDGSASIGGAVGLYEPVHGSAPDIAGQGIANPLGAILSAAMLLRYSFKLEAEAACIESAVAAVLASGSRTRDLARAGESVLSTSAMGQKVAVAVRERAQPAGEKAAS